jgi:hypothetical protein
MKALRHILSGSKVLLISAVLGLSVLSTGTVSVIQPQVAGAQSTECDDKNIIRCGLNGSTLSGNIDSFQSFYNKDSDNGHNDLQEVYNWAGTTDSDVRGMNTTNTKMGTLYRNGEVKVNGKTVARDAWVSARFTKGDGFVKIRDGVWARKTTTSFEHASVPALVHYDGNGNVDWVVMRDCGNAVKVTPVRTTTTTTPTPPAVTPPPSTPDTPRPTLACTALNAMKDLNSPRTYTFTGEANAKETEISNYVFDFGDGTRETLASNSGSVDIKHTYPADGQSYTAKVWVNGTSHSNITSDNCVVTITTPTAVTECKPGIPVGDARCVDECKPGIPVGDARCVDETPVELPKAGVGSVLGIFAGTSALGALGHRLYVRRMHRVE